MDWMLVFSWLGVVALAIGAAVLCRHAWRTALEEWEDAFSNEPASIRHQRRAIRRMERVMRVQRRLEWLRKLVRF